MQIPKRLGTKRVTELAFSETVEGIAQAPEDLKILFLQRVTVASFAKTERRFLSRHSPLRQLDRHVDYLRDGIPKGLIGWEGRAA